MVDGGEEAEQARAIAPGPLDRARAPRRRRSGRRPGRRPSPQAPQVGDQGGDLFVGEVERRHLGAGLDALRRRPASGSCPRGVRQRRRADRRAAADVAEVRARASRGRSCPTRCGSRRRRWWSAVAGRGAPGRSAAWPPARGWRRASAGSRRALSTTTVNVILACCDAAELGAHPVVRAGARRRELQVVGDAGDEVGLAHQLRHPQAVDHVARSQRQLDPLADRHVDLVGRHHAVVGIGHPPPPQLAVDRRRGRPPPAAPARCSPARSARRRRRARRPAAPPRRAAGNAGPALLARASPARPPAPCSSPGGCGAAAHRHHDQRHDDHLDHGGHPEHQPPQPADPPRLRRDCRRASTATTTSSRRAATAPTMTPARRAGATPHARHQPGPTGSLKSPVAAQHTVVADHELQLGQRPRRRAADGHGAAQHVEARLVARAQQGGGDRPRTDRPGSRRGCTPWSTPAARRRPARRGWPGDRRSVGSTRTSTACASAAPTAPSGNTVSRPSAGTRRRAPARRRR